MIPYVLFHSFDVFTIYSGGADLDNHCYYYYLTLLVIYEHLNILAIVTP